MRDKLKIFRFVKSQIKESKKYCVVKFGSGLRKISFVSTSDRENNPSQGD
ncbi:MAG: hypothetical protein V7K14_00625 [Nostoc sp.]